MPTPFMHMWVAEQLADFSPASDLPPRALPVTLPRAWPAFYFGNIAPDFQAICGIRRSATHFYGLPPRARDEAVVNLLAENPHLASGAELAPEHAAFVAGYLAHLHLDLIWHFDVVVPFFIESTQVTQVAQGHVLHLVLLAYLDRQAQSRLSAAAGDQLRAAKPQRWVAFAPDQHLCEWRDYVAGQLEPGGMSRTAEIYAARLGMTPELFVEKLEDGPWRDAELFGRIPVAEVEQVLQLAVPRTRELVTTYLLGHLQPQQGQDAIAK